MKRDGDARKADCMRTIDSDTRVADLVIERPATIQILERLRIDYCCGGARTLGEACAESGLDVQRVARELESAIAPANDDACAGVESLRATQLIEHIVSVHHARLRRDLPRLVALADKTAAAHGARHPELKQVSQTARRLWSELDSHLMKEESILFPAIVDLDRSRATELCGGDVSHPLAVMESEHEDAGAALVELRSLSNDFTPPADACPTWRALASGLAEFTVELHRHIHEENNLLHPSARALATRVAPRSPR